MSPFNRYGIYLDAFLNTAVAERRGRVLCTLLRQQHVEGNDSPSPALLDSLPPLRSVGRGKSSTQCQIRAVPLCSQQRAYFVSLSLALISSPVPLPAGLLRATVLFCPFLFAAQHACLLAFKEFKGWLSSLSCMLPFAFPYLACVGRILAMYL